MDDIAILAMMNGINHVSSLQCIESNNIHQWIKKIDFDKHPFFVKLREYIVSLAKTKGIEFTANQFKVPAEIINILLNELPPEKIKTHTKELKNKAIAMYIDGLSITEVAKNLGVKEEKVSFWILNHTMKPTKKVKIEVKNEINDEFKEEYKEELKEEVRLDFEEEDLIAEEKKDDDIEMNIGNIGLQSFSNNKDQNVIDLEDEFDAIMKESIR